MAVITHTSSVEVQRIFLAHADWTPSQQASKLDTRKRRDARGWRKRNSDHQKIWLVTWLSSGGHPIALDAPRRILGDQIRLTPSETVQLKKTCKSDLYIERYATVCAVVDCFDGQPARADSLLLAGFRIPTAIRLCADIMSLIHLLGKCLSMQRLGCSQ